MKKKILVLGTGGTIASGGENGLRPALGTVKMLERLPLLCEEYDIAAKDILQLDSSNIQPEEWRCIAEHVDKEHAYFDGVVITHGTDTLSYTAAALSFMLRGISVPVVLTGSQLPLEHPLTDAYDNLRYAFAMAASATGGVFVSFGGRILLGSRAVKVRTTGFDAFESVNHPYVADIRARGALHINTAALPPHASYRFTGDISGSVFLIKLTPGLDPAIFDMLAGMKYEGVVIEAFGAGGLHYIHRDLPAKLELFSSHRIPVVITSQCLYEKSDLSIYEVGRRALAGGAVDAGDMTTEAAFVKLKWLLAQGLSYERICAAMRENFAGEIESPDSAPSVFS